jgi:hypothetical protein
MVELFLIPLTLTVGSILIFFGVHGLPTGLQFSRSGVPGRFHIRHDVAAGFGSVLPRLQPRPPSRQDDILLADLMTEMIELRVEMAELREKFETAITAARPAATRPRKVSKAS